MINVVLVDDHDLVRHALQALLHSDDQITVIQQGRTGNEAIKLYETLAPDVIVLDLQLPGKSGLTASQKILSTNPNAKIVILTTSINDLYIMKLQRIGILGFVTKSSSSTDLISAVHHAARGEPFYCKHFIEHMYQAHSEHSIFSKLTKQEFDIILQLAYGMSVEEIANALCIEKITVYTHKNNAYEKLNIRSIKQLPYLAMKHGLYPKVKVTEAN